MIAVSRTSAPVSVPNGWQPRLAHVRASAGSPLEPLGSKGPKINTMGGVATGTAYPTGESGQYGDRPLGLVRLAPFYRKRSRRRERVFPLKRAISMRTWMCLICGWIYDEEAGLPEEGIAPGTRWEDVPPNWVCPECGARKEDFELIEI